MNNIAIVTGSFNRFCQFKKEYCVENLNLIWVHDNESALSVDYIGIIHIYPPPKGIDKCYLLAGLAKSKVLVKKSFFGRTIEMFAKWRWKK